MTMNEIVQLKTLIYSLLLFIQVNVIDEMKKGENITVLTCSLPFH